jgi:hypothetical protein
MGRYVFAVYSNPVAGREQEYNEWYSHRHLEDLLACPGILSARRLTLAHQQVSDVATPFKYFSLYEIETDNLQEFIDELTARAGTERMPRSSALGDYSAVLWKVM